MAAVRTRQYTWETHERFLTDIKTNTVFLYGNQPDWHDWRRRVQARRTRARNKHVNEAKFFSMKGSRSRGRDRLQRTRRGDKSNPIKGSLVQKLFRENVCVRIHIRTDVQKSFKKKKKKNIDTNCKNKIKNFCSRSRVNNTYRWYHSPDTVNARRRGAVTLYCLVNGCAHGQCNRTGAPKG